MNASHAFVDLAAVAEILGELGNEIETLGVSLCSDPILASQHVEALQSFDLIAQKQRSLAALLRANCPISARAALGLEELRVRLGASFGAG